MPVTVEVNEGSSLIVTASFKDESGKAVTPESVTWTLVDRTGTIINSRQDVSVTPSSSVSIALTGDDLKRSGAGAGDRFLVVKGTYDHPDHGLLDIVDEYHFTIEDLKGVS